MSRLGGFTGSGLGSYYGLNEALLQRGSQTHRQERSDYDDRDTRIRDIESRRSDSLLGVRREADDYSQYRDVSPRRSTSRSDRYSPKPQRSYDTTRDRQQGSWAEPVSYPLAHVGLSRSSDHNQDRGRNQNRNRNRNNGRPGNSRGPSNQGLGILGAKPGDRVVPDIPLPGAATHGLTAQIAQQQQQLMAMVQTQSLLAAMQGQLKQGISMMPNALMSNAMGPRVPPGAMIQQRQMNRKRPMTQDWRDGGGAYKRNRMQSPQNKWQNRQNQQQGQRPRQRPKQTRWSGTATGTTTEKRKTPEQKKATESEKKKKEDDEVEPEEEEEEEEEEEDASALEGEEGEGDVETEEIEAEGSPAAEDVPEPDKVLNFAGEDVDALMISLFDDHRKKFICQECKIICIKEDSFRRHLLGRRHVTMMLEKVGKTFVFEQFKKFGEGTVPAAIAQKAKRKEDAEADTDTAQEEPTSLDTPTHQAAATSEEDYDFVRYMFDTRKTAVKEDDAITISSVTKARVRINGFTSGRNMYGCEFVKAVSGFNCRLCKAFIRCGNDVTHHIRAKKHQRNYQLYVNEHPEYEENQKIRNQELDDVLAQREGEEVVLYEVLDEDSNKQRKRRKDSLDLPEVEVTKFVLATKEDEEGSHEDDKESSHEDDKESLHEDDKESLHEDDKEEQIMHTDIPHETSDVLETTEDADANADAKVDEELLKEELPEDGIKILDNIEREEFPPPQTELPETDHQEQETVEETFSPPEPSPTTRRARRGGARQVPGRGRGRGRGARKTGRGARQGLVTKRGAVKRDDTAAEAGGAVEEVGLMEGFEVIDEIGDAEEE